MSIIRRLTEFWMRLRGATDLDIEIYRVRRNIDIDAAKLEEMDYQWRRDNSPCCPSCRFFPVYTEICDKQERRLNWLKVLEKRKNG